MEEVDLQTQKKKEVETLNQTFRIEIEHRNLQVAFDMEDGQPLRAHQLEDSLWGCLCIHHQKSIESVVSSCELKNSIYDY